jgi:hypothetical protein
MNANDCLLPRDRAIGHVAVAFVAITACTEPTHSRETKATNTVHEDVIGEGRGRSICQLITRIGHSALFSESERTGPLVGAPAAEGEMTPWESTKVAKTLEPDKAE